MQRWIAPAGSANIPSQQFSNTSDKANYAWEATRCLMCPTEQAVDQQGVALGEGQQARELGRVGRRGQQSLTQHLYLRSSLRSQQPLHFGAAERIGEVLDGPGAQPTPDQLVDGITAKTGGEAFDVLGR